MVEGKFFNRLLSIVLCIAMCTTLFPAAAFAEETAPGDAATTSGELQPAASPTEEPSAPESPQGNASDPVDTTGSADSAPDATVPEETPTAETPTGAESVPESTPPEETPTADPPAGTESSPEGTVPEETPTAEIPAGTESSPEGTVPEEISAEGSADIPVAYSDGVAPQAVGDTFTVDDLTYEVLTVSDGSGNGTVEVSNAASGITAAIIPETVENQGENYSVTSIADNAFTQCSELTSVHIPDGAMRIGGQAFSYCSNLTSIYIPDGVTSIGCYAFTNCSRLASIDLPDGLSNIEVGTFSGCSGLTSASIPDSVTAIQYNAFDGCSSLTDISIPDNVTRIWASAFVDCSGLSSITIPDRVSNIEPDTFRGCTGLTSIHIPEHIGRIDSSAFSGCSSLESVTFAPNSNFWDIGEKAFSGCSRLSSIVMPVSVSSLGSYLFENCTALTSVTLPKEITQIPEGMFYNCTALHDVTIHHTVTSVGIHAFRNCNNLSVVYFDGSAAQWNKIQIANYNEPLKNASVQYTTESYPITYVLGGGKNSASNPYSYTETSDTIVLSAPTRAGYSFAGWYAESYYYTKITQIAKGSTGAKTLYAKWSVSTYPINYNLDGGNQNAKNPTRYTVETADITLANPTRKGYNFGGWYTNSSFTTRVTKIAKGSTGTRNLYAKWNLATYKITYELDGGTQNPENPASYTFASSDITLASPTRANCTFVGWYTSSAYTTKVTTIPKGSIGSKYLYAKWDTATYPINYHLDGGNQNAKNPNSYTVETADITLANPTRKGYNFGGWYTTNDFTTRVTKIAKGSSGAMELYAKWNLATYKLTYILDGGTQNAKNPAAYTFQTENLTLANPTRKGYAFAGWYTSSTYATRVTTIPTGSIGSRTLYAKWNLSTYPINYNLNGGNQNAANPVRYTTETADITLANPSRKGYNFGGWYTNSSFTTRITKIAKGSAGTWNLYAKWNLATYKLTYVLNGGTQNAQNPASYTFLSEDITPASPTRENYTFDGWYTSSTFITKVTTIPTGSIGSRTLYAKWKAASYPINYTLNGGNQNANNPTSYTMETADITLASPSRKGYNFGGWYADSEFTTRVTTIAKGSTGAKDLYAKWNLATYKLTYTLNGGTLSTSNPATYTFTTPTITLTNPTRANYTFAGWYTSTSYTTKVTTIPTGSIGSKNLYAKWDATAYPINYTLNGGNQNAANPATYTIETADITLASPSRRGYNFGGWYADSSFTTRVTKITQGSTGAKDLYAKWNLATYKLNYTLNSGTQNAQNPTTYTFSSPTITLANPSRKGYNFGGWYTSSAFTTRVTTIPTGSIGSRNLYAKWNLATYKLNYILDGGTQNPQNPATYTFLSADITLAEPTRANCSFAGWYTSSSYTTRVTTIPTGSIGSKNLYAKWDVSTYTISYAGNGATGGTMPDKTGCQVGVSYTLDALAYKRIGYQFVAWNTSPDGSGTFYFNKETVKDLASQNGAVVTLYALWDPDPDYKYTAGDSFVYYAHYGNCAFEITVGNNTKLGTVQNRYSDYYGRKAVGIPITITNIDSTTARIDSFDIDSFSSSGVESPKFTYYFDDNEVLYQELRPGASLSGYIYVLYTGSGDYFVRFTSNYGSWKLYHEIKATA